MKRAICLLVFGSLLVLCGCIPLSLHPLYTEKDLVFDDALIGIWEMENGEEEFVFEKSGPLTYTMIEKEEYGEAEFDAHLLKLGDELFLDLYPRNYGDDMNSMLRDHLVPVHSFYRIHQLEPALILSTFDYSWLENRLEENEKALPHAYLDDGLVLTASTAELQAFVLKHLETEGAFSETETLERSE